jgi:hypothetical protein
MSARCAARQRRSPAISSKSSHHQRLEQAVLAQRRRQLVELVRVEVLPWLSALGHNLVDRTREHVAFTVAGRGRSWRARAALWLGRHARRQERVEAAAQTA